MKNFIHAIDVRFIYNMHDYRSTVKIVIELHVLCVKFLNLELLLFCFYLFNIHEYRLFAVLYYT